MNPDLYLLSPSMKIDTLQRQTGLHFPAYSPGGVKPDFLGASPAAVCIDSVQAEHVPELVEWGDLAEHCFPEVQKTLKPIQFNSLA